jgi:bifunctional DNA-binding transcriptional regulator/antitoxin component of YhaV-PrlF toxin-antitoxin module
VVKLKVKAVKIGNSVRATIPREILEEADVKAGDMLQIDFDKESGCIILEKAPE